jgi:hypothetical protein
MITGVKKISLTPEVILSKITEYDIFRYYMPDTLWKINRATISPFPRSDGASEQHPSFIIGNRGGSLSFIDFADTNKRGDCFTFVKMLFNLLNIDEVLTKIDQDFGLGISPSNKPLGDYKKIVGQYKQPEEAGKRYALVQAVTRKFTKEELEYWSSYYQGIDDLRANHIYSIESIYLNRQKFSLKEDELRFGYLYEGHWKIYRPFGNKKSKWVPNNVPITVMEGLENLKGSPYAFITKSKKDYMVLRKIIDPVCATQNEGIACFSEENLLTLRSETGRQILSYDSDGPGVANSQQITQAFGFDYCNVPRKYLQEGIKDWADLAKAHGLEVIREYLKEKGII